MVDIQLDVAGVSEVLHSREVVSAINDLADRIAADVRGQVGDRITVEVDHYHTDRGAASVLIADPTGMALQARSGVLTRAAAAAGLEVRAR